METEKDVYVMYLVVRESLNMSIGKTAAQCAHASMQLVFEYIELKEMHGKKEDVINFNNWIDSGYRKVVLKADEKEWVKIKEEFKDDLVIITDLGLTELEPNTETVIGFMPMLKYEAPKIIKKLQLLK